MISGASGNMSRISSASHRQRQPSWLHTLLALTGPLICILSACVPAKVPSQLVLTPGPAVVVTDHQIRMPSGAIIQRLPDWRVLLNAADAPEALTLIAPDDRTVIILSPDAAYPLPEIATLPTDERVVEIRRAEGPDGTLHLWLITMPDNLDHQLQALTHTLETLQFAHHP